MSAAVFLSLLHKVKHTGQGRYMACCPAHQDRSASLAVKELDDGRVLLHCFAGCDAAAVLGAVGLTFADLMPESLLGERRPVKHAFSAWDVLKALALECTFIQLCALRMAKPAPLAETDLARLHVAANRIKAAVVAIGGEV